MSKSELEPCPWCRSLRIGQDASDIFCLNCGAVGPRVSFGKPFSAEERWNTRATPTAPIGKEPSEDEIERVARAIALECDVDPDVLIGMYGRRVWEKEFCAQARAAITALRSGERG